MNCCIRSGVIIEADLEKIIYEIFYPLANLEGIYYKNKQTSIATVVEQSSKALLIHKNECELGSEFIPFYELQIVRGQLFMETASKFRKPMKKEESRLQEKVFERIFGQPLLNGIWLLSKKAEKREVMVAMIKLYIKGYTISGVAEKLGIPDNTIKKYNKDIKENATNHFRYNFSDVVEVSNFYARLFPILG